MIGAVSIFHWFGADCVHSVMQNGFVSTCFMPTVKMPPPGVRRCDSLFTLPSLIPCPPAPPPA